MINSIINYLEGFDPLLNSFNQYSVFVYSVLFLALFIKTKNYLALIIVGESILGYLVGNYLSSIHILAITGQFMVYGFAVYLSRKNPLILLSYLILIAHFLIQYISNSIHLVNNTIGTYNIASLVYYSFYILLPLVLYLMIKGLFNKGGGLRNGYDNSFNNVVYDDNNVLYSDIR